MNLNPIKYMSVEAIISKYLKMHSKKDGGGV